MVNLNSILPIITLIVNSLSTLLKRDWLEKQNLTLHSPKATNLKHTDIGRLKVEGWEKIYHAYTNKKMLESLYWLLQSRFQNKDYC